jgi:hypothetical protein
VIGYCKDSVARAKNAAVRQESVIRVGTSFMTPGEFLLRLRPKILRLCPELKFELIPFDNTPENAREILRNLGRNVDVVAGWFDDAYEETRGCASLKLEDAPICCALGIHHRLAAKKRLTVDDLRQENLLLIRRGWNLYVDKLRDFAERERIAVIDFDFYNLSIFNRCENSSDVLMVFDFWKHAHPLIKILPVEWEFTVPYGLLHAPVPSEAVKGFLDAVLKAKEA